MTTGQYENMAEQLLSQDYQSTAEKLDSINHRIALRKHLEYKNIRNLENARQRLEESLNQMGNSISAYAPNPKMLSAKSRLETEMISIELKKGEEAVNSFRDVERLEAEKRNLTETIKSEASIIQLVGTQYGSDKPYRPIP